MNLSLSAAASGANPAKKYDFEVHTMPAKFLSMRPSSARTNEIKPKLSGAKKTILVGTVIIVAVGVLMVAAAWLFLRSVKKDQPPLASSPGIIQPESPAVAETAKEPAEEPETEEPTDERPDENLLEVNNWMSYVDNLHYYQFKYPKSWLVKVNNNPPAPKDCLEQLILEDSAGQTQLNILVFANNSNLPLDHWLEQNTNYTVASEALNVYDIPAYKFNQGLNGVSIYTVRNQKVYNFNFSHSGDQPIAAVHDQILTNFQFNQPIIEEEPTEEAEKIYPLARDTDSDSLTDKEELLYGTDPTKPDTDGDTFNDALEVANLYDPTVPGNAKIYDSDLVATYVNSSWGYNLIYPTSWQIKEMADGALFQSDTGEFVQILVQPNDSGYRDIGDWYLDQFNHSGGLEIKRMEVDGQPAIKSGDNLRVYLLFGDRIYGIIYNIGLRQDTNFMTTFSMMVKSFKLMP